MRFFQSVVDYSCAAHYNVLMKQNLTLKLDDELLYRAKIVAAQKRKSLSALVRDFLTDMVTQRPQPKDQALSRLKAVFATGLYCVKEKAARDELHNR